MARSQTNKAIDFEVIYHVLAAEAWADGAVYAMTYALGSNEVKVYQRASNENLSVIPVQTAATGGGGSGLQPVPINSLGSAGSRQIDHKHRLLFVK